MINYENSDGGCQLIPGEVESRWQEISWRNTASVYKPLDLKIPIALECRLLLSEILGFETWCQDLQNEGHLQNYLEIVDML